MWPVVICRVSLEDGYQRFGGNCRLKMEAVRSYETLVTTYKAKWHCNQENHINKVISVSSFALLLFSLS
jgi:hypothetical protein